MPITPNARTNLFNGDGVLFNNQYERGAAKSKKSNMKGNSSNILTTIFVFRNIILWLYLKKNSENKF